MNKLQYTCWYTGLSRIFPSCAIPINKTKVLICLAVDSHRYEQQGIMGNHVDNLEIIDQFMVVAKVKLLHKRKKKNTSEQQQVWQAASEAETRNQKPKRFLCSLFTWNNHFLFHFAMLAIAPLPWKVLDWWGGGGPVWSVRHLVNLQTFIYIKHATSLSFNSARLEIPTGFWGSHWTMDVLEIVSNVVALVYSTCLYRVH